MGTEEVLGLDVDKEIEESISHELRLLGEAEAATITVEVVGLETEPVEPVDAAEDADGDVVAWVPDSTPIGECAGILSQLRYKKSTKHKVAFLQSENSGPLRYLLRAIYDPTITYGITLGRISEFEIDNSEGTRPIGWEEFATVLNKLASREISGNHAVDVLSELLNEADQASAHVIMTVIDRDARAGIGADLINKAIPDLIPKFKVMLSKPYNPKKIRKWPVLVEPKLDGFRGVAIASLSEALWEENPTEYAEILEGLDRGTVRTADLGEAQVLTRTGNRQEGVSVIESDLLELMFRAKIQSCVFDGELVSGSFNETASALRTEGEIANDAVFHIFDMVGGQEFASSTFTKPLRERRRNLATLGQSIRPGSNLRLNPSYFANSYGEVEQYFSKIHAAGGEGVMVKDLDSLYEKKRSFSWMKIKAEETTEGTIVGLEPGTGKNEDTFGALLVKLESNGVVVSVSGFTDEQRLNLFRQHQLGNLVGRVIEIEFHEWTPDGSLRHPRFKRIRDDKRPSAWG